VTRMTHRQPIGTRARRAVRGGCWQFWQCEEGAILVEFAITLPLILILAFLSVESMRLFWSYQAVIAGVRDATRYLARVAPADLCTSGGNVNGYAAQLKAIVESTINGTALFPAGVTVTSLTSAHTCITSLGLRQASVPVATVSANVSITMPFSQVLRMVGAAPAATITTTVRDQARVYGL
jgi:Flp pilus assembly protein TadG